MIPADFVTAKGAATLAVRHGARRVWLVNDDSYLPGFDASSRSDSQRWAFESSAVDL
jgi:hypothetical protein